MMRVLDLFSGIGGFSLGLERTAGFKTVAFCEIDPFCRRVLSKHWPDVPCHDDITTREFMEGEADVVTGGFPCQDVSRAGKRAGLAGERSGLYRELVRAIRLVRPRYAILENVAALLGDGMGTVLGDLAESGFDCEWDCIPAKSLGAPHERDRVYIIAHADMQRCGEAGQLRYRPFEMPARGVEASQPSNPSRIGRRQGRQGRFADSFAWIRNAARRNVAVLPSARLEGREQFETTRETFPVASGSYCNPWRTWTDEPEIQGMDDGLSYELDCIRRFTEQGDTPENKSKINTIIGTFLRAVWDYRETSETSSYVYICRLHDCVPEMPFGDPQGRWFLGKRIKENKGLCDLWAALYSKPFEETQDLQRKVLECAWQVKCPKEMETWVHRTRATGNAVVPQIPELIGHAILRQEYAA